ncbi:metallophosphoesterase [Halobaculum litoreum]|uniref:Phosphoesterase n=1 Tax=Halobaculum litoreum TaxID=3031998 RepID=A0ABD5XN13_9EURY|nr:metallophosphoesterase [Halobaculum sp. DT92]
MLVGVVSDTHDNAQYVDAAVDAFTEVGVDAVVHCGDVVVPFSVTPFDGDWAFHAVRGNNDGERALADTVDEFGTYHGEFAALTLADTEFAVYHGTSEPIVDALLASGEYDYVCRGHTHERVHEVRDAAVRLNPGGVPIPGREEGPTALVVDTATDKVATHELE